MIKNFLIIFFILVANSLAYGQQSVSENCSACYGNKNIECDQKCAVLDAKTNPGKFAKCKRSCVVNGCKNSCNYKVGNKGALPEVVNCDYCLRESKISCQKTCGEDVSEDCVKRCASSACAKNCSLPTVPQEAIAEDHEQTAEDLKTKCTSCKTANEDACMASCGSGTGALTCKVICLERKCEADCLVE